MGFHTDEHRGIRNRVFAKADKPGGGEGESLRRSRIIRLSLDLDPLPFFELGKWIKFDAPVREINTGGAGFRRI
jgi:hypothetical protein